MDVIDMDENWNFYKKSFNKKHKWYFIFTFSQYTVQKCRYP